MTSSVTGFTGELRSPYTPTRRAVAPHPVRELLCPPLGNGIPRNDTNTPSLVILGAPTFTSVVLGSSTIAIEGSTTYDATLFNPGGTLTGVSIQGYILQGTTNRAAGGTIIECTGTFDGILPPGSCTSSATVTVSNTVGGTGTLVPGPATLHLDLYNGTATFDSEDVLITLQ